MKEITLGAASSKNPKNLVLRTSPQKKLPKERRSKGAQDQQKQFVEVKESNEEDMVPEKIYAKEVDPISMFPLYILPWMLEVAKPTKDLEAVKYKIFMPLFLD